MSALLCSWLFGQILTSVPEIRLCLRRQQVGSGSVELSDHFHLSTTEITRWFSSLLQEPQQWTQNCWQALGKTGIMATSHTWKNQHQDKLPNLETVEHRTEDGWMDGCPDAGYQGQYFHYTFSGVMVCSHKVEKQAKWWHPPVHEGSNMSNLPMGTREEGSNPTGMCTEIPSDDMPKNWHTRLNDHGKYTFPESYSQTCQTPPALHLLG